MLVAAAAAAVANALMTVVASSRQTRMTLEGDDLVTQLLASDALTPEARAEITEMRGEALHDTRS